MPRHKDTTWNVIEATAALDGAPFVVVRANRVGVIVWANKAASALFESGELVGQNINDFVDSGVLTTVTGLERLVSSVRQEVEGSTDLLHFIEVNARAKSLEATLVGEVQRMSHLVWEDHLTGLLNRRSFGAALERAKTDPTRKFGIAVFDLDGFKTINDELGHEAGDSALAAFGQRLASLTRKDDRAYRIGGDEFAVLIEDVDAEDFEDIVSRIRKELPFEWRHGSAVALITASIGSAHSCASVNDLVARADKKMYENKRETEAGGLKALANRSDGAA